METRFLKDFIQMRQKLHTTENTSKKNKPEPPSISIATIIEKKPPVKDVVEFFRNKNSLE
jgi:hypothetical protein